MRPTGFKIGQRVMAKWPGSAKFYPAKVLKQAGDELEVEFDEGTIYSVPVQHVKTDKPSRSRSRSKSKSPSRTKSKRLSSRLSNQKSPARSRSRSPKRAAASRSTPLQQQQPPSKQAAESVSADKGSGDVRQSLRVRGRPKLTSDKAQLQPTRSSARKASQQPADYMARTEELLPSGESDLEIDLIETNNRWHIPWAKIAINGWVAFLLIFCPLFPVWLNMVCGKSDCSVRMPKLLKKNMEAYITVEAMLVCGGFFLLQALLMALPIGKSVVVPHADGGCVKYRLNGVHTLGGTIAIAAAIGTYVYPLNQLVRITIPLIVASTLYSIIFALYLFARAPKTASGHQEKLNRERSFVAKYFMGRELNPQIGFLDVKTLLDGRIGLNAWAVVILCYMWETLKERTWTSSVLLVAVLQLLYIFYWHWYEESMLSTWEFKSEAVGFMLAFGNMTFVPFVFTIPTRYLSLHHLDLVSTYLGPTLLLFAVGFTILRNSNHQKDEFKRDPGHPKFSAMRIICGDKKSKKILADGWWRLMRHPNYLGDLLVAASFSLPCGFHHVVPHVYFVYLLMLLVVRVLRVEGRCKSTYGSQWTEYCQQVKYRILPYIF